VTSTHVQVALAGAIPALVAMWFVDRLDAKRPEPASLRRLVVLAGMFSTIPAIILELVLTTQVGGQLQPIALTYQGASFQSFVVAAAVEEACKIAVIYWVVWRRPEFDERMDGIVYASRAGLGFALVENVLYLLHAHATGDTVAVWVQRAILAVPGHAMWSGMIGYVAARRRFDHVGPGLVGGYLLAVAFHGGYDCTVFVRGPLLLEGHHDLATLMALGPVAFTVAAFFVLRHMARTALRYDDAAAASAAVQAILRRSSSGGAA